MQAELEQTYPRLGTIYSLCSVYYPNIRQRSDVLNRRNFLKTGFYEGIKLSLTPVSRLGLLCVEPVEMLRFEAGAYGYKAEASWIDCPRNDEAFMGFLREILDVLGRSEPPEGSPTCRWCQYRDAARQNLL